MKKKTQSRYAPQRVREGVRRELGDYQIVDALEDLPIVVLEQDLKASFGRQKDHTRCVLASACRRMYGMQDIAYFWKSVAFVAIPDEYGQIVIKRYKLSREAQRIVALFDKGHQVSSSIMVWLNAPPPSYTLDAMREAERKRRARRKAAMKGILIESKKNGRVHSSAKRKGVPVKIDPDVRRGTGIAYQSIVVSRRKKK